MTSKITTTKQQNSTPPSTSVHAVSTSNLQIAIGEKMVCTRFELLKKATSTSYKLCIFYSADLWFIDHTHSTGKILMRLRMLKLSVGKGHQLIKQLCSRVLQYYTTVPIDIARWVYALQSSSYKKNDRLKKITKFNYVIILKHTLQQA